VNWEGGFSHAATTPISTQAPHGRLDPAAKRRKNTAHGAKPWENAEYNTAPAGRKMGSRRIPASYATSVDLSKGRTMAKKRNLFHELMDGMAAMKAHRTGKITLRSYKVEPRALPEVKPKMIKQVRAPLPLFPQRLCPQTLHQRTHPGKMGARPRQAECPGSRPAITGSEVSRHVRPPGAAGKLER
jgi:hypothetical protein